SVHRELPAGVQPHRSDLERSEPSLTRALAAESKLSYGGGHRRRSGLAGGSFGGGVLGERTRALARLAYPGSDGLPRVIPVGFHWDGEQIIVCTVPTSPKVPALQARPHVALTIDTDAGPASRALSVRGVVSVDIVDGVPAEYLAASTRG